MLNLFGTECISASLVPIRTLTELVSAKTNGAATAAQSGTELVTRDAYNVPALSRILVIRVQKSDFLIFILTYGIFDQKLGCHPILLTYSKEAETKGNHMNYQGKLMSGVFALN